MSKAARPLLRDGLRVRLVKGFYDGPTKDPKTYKPYMIWCGGDPIPVGAAGTVRRAPPELVPGPKKPDGTPRHYWPWMIVWDNHPARDDWYYGLGHGYHDEQGYLADNYEEIPPAEPDADEELARIQTVTTTHIVERL